MNSTVILLTIWGGGGHWGIEQRENHPNTHKVLTNALTINFVSAPFKGLKAPQTSCYGVSGLLDLQIGVLTSLILLTIWLTPCVLLVGLGVWGGCVGGWVDIVGVFTWGWAGLVGGVHLVKIGVAGWRGCCGLW